MDCQTRFRGLRADDRQVLCGAITGVESRLTGLNTAIQEYKARVEGQRGALQSQLTQQVGQARAEAQTGSVTPATRADIQRTASQLAAKTAEVARLKGQVAAYKRVPGFMDSLNRYMDMLTGTLKGTPSVALSPPTTSPEKPMDVDEPQGSVAVEKRRQEQQRQQEEQRQQEQQRQRQDQERQRQQQQRQRQEQERQRQEQERQRQRQEQESQRQRQEQERQEQQQQRQEQERQRQEQERQPQDRQQSPESVTVDVIKETKTKAAKKTNPWNPPGEMDNFNRLLINSMLMRASRLHEVYDPGFAFPHGSIQYLYDSPAYNIHKLGRLVEVWHNQPRKIKMDNPFGPKEQSPNPGIKAFTRRREPVNIAMTRHYNEESMKMNFSYKFGMYDAFFNYHKRLGPNFGIYCTTPVLLQTPADESQLVEIQTPFPEDAPLINVYNAIALAFDTAAQPDYQYYYEMGNQAEIFPAYVNIFHKIFLCASAKQMKRIVFSFIGGGAFAALFKPFQHGNSTFTNFGELYTAAFEAAQAATNYQGEISFMGTQSALPSPRLQMLQKWMQQKSYTDVGRVPEVFSKVDRESTMFVNAWDPHSIVGNGNAKDPSLDGRFGRRTAMALLCWPLTNMYMNYIRVHGVAAA